LHLGAKEKKKDVTKGREESQVQQKPIACRGQCETPIKLHTKTAEPIRELTSNNNKVRIRGGRKKLLWGQEGGTFVVFFIKRGSNDGMREM